MSIQNITNSSQSINSYKSTEAKTQQSTEKTENTLADAALNNDVVELSSKYEPVNNKVYTQDTAKINYLKQVAENNANTLKQMVDKLFSNQSQVGSSLLNVNESFFSFKFDFSFEEADTKFSFNFNYEKYDFSAESIRQNNGIIEIDQATRDEAAGLIGEDGPLGVKQVTDNILGFAKALCGSDPSKIDILKDAFIKGFDQVADIFGGKDKMPEISQKTYDAVMKGFDEWANAKVDTEA